MSYEVVHKDFHASIVMKEDLGRFDDLRSLTPGLPGNSAAGDLSVDAVMRVAQDILWPDDARKERSRQTGDIEAIRAQEYSVHRMRPPSTGRRNITAYGLNKEKAYKGSSEPRRQRPAATPAE